MNRDYNDLAMISHPERWPRWPLLPLKRRTAKGEWELGTLVGAPEVGFEVVLADMYTFRLSAAKLKSIEYDNANDVLADGWLVD